MNFMEFANAFQNVGVININQLRLRFPGFNRNNITNWIKKGYLVRLKNGWYCLPGRLQQPDFNRYIGTAIYRPSYISLQAALSFYDIIPEMVVDFTLVTSMKTTQFSNPAGQYFYYSVKPELMFGYKPVKTPAGLTYLLATPEKAILDFLYLYPQYNTPDELYELRFDEVFMTEELDRERLSEYLARYDSKTLTNRIATLLNLY